MRNPQLINPFGGNKIIIAEVTLIAGVWTLTTPVEDSTCFDLGDLNKEEYSTDTAKVVIPNSAGGVSYTRFDKTPVTKGIMMEAGKTKRDYLCYGVIGKFHLQYHYQGIRGGKYQEELSIGQITPQDANSFPEGATTFPYEFTKLQMEAATVISAQNITDIEACFTPDLVIRMAGPATILINRYDILTETSV